MHVANKNDITQYTHHTCDMKSGCSQAKLTKDPQHKSDGQTRCTFFFFLVSLFFWCYNTIIPLLLPYEI